MTHVRAKVTERGQVTIPKRLRDRLGIRPGESLEFEEGEPGTLIARKASSVSSVDRAYGSLELDRPTDELIDELRGTADPR